MQTATATATAEAWLDAFAASLDSRDIRAVLALFGPECFWRDLVAFTWNLHIEEGAEAIAATLAARLEDVAPRGFALRGEASEHEGLLEAATNCSILAISSLTLEKLPRRIARWVMIP